MGGLQRGLTATPVPATGRRWSPAQIPDLTGRVAVVTGANSGIGFHTALQMAAHGASTVLGARDPERGEDAVARLRQAVPGASVELRRLDLADLSSVREFATCFGESHHRLDVLVNNAGVMNLPYGSTADGFETHFGTNHLGHFALTGTLLPLLLASPGARVVTVSSLLAAVGMVDFDNLQGERGYRPRNAYALSKLANQLFMMELDRRAEAAGAGLVSTGAHPGWAATNLQTRGPRMQGRRFQELLNVMGNSLFAQSDADGAMPSLYAAAAPGVRGGEYFGPRRLGGIRGEPVRAAPVGAARNLETARRLWEVSERLTGVQYRLTEV